MKFSRKVKLSLLAAAAIVAATAAIKISAANAGETDNSADTAATTEKPSQRNRSGAGRVIYQDDFTNAAEQTVNGVVSVKSYATPRQSRMSSADCYFNDPLLEFFFGSPRRQPQQPRQPQQEEAQPRQIGLGSGVIISSDGYIVTNNHVI